MTPTRHLTLRIDVPTLEPDAAVVERLAIAGASSVPSVGTPWMVGVRTALVAFVVAFLGATTWAAGALAGVDTPFRHPSQSAAPTPTGTAGSPQPGGSPSGSPASSGLPDASSGIPGLGVPATRGHHHAHRQAHRNATAHHRSRHQRRHHRHGHHASSAATATLAGPHRHGARHGHHYGWGNRRSAH